MKLSKNSTTILTINIAWKAAILLLAGLSCVTPKLLHLWLVDIWNLRNVFRLLTKRQRTYASTTTAAAFFERSARKKPLIFNSVSRVAANSNKWCLFSMVSFLSLRVILLKPWLMLFCPLKILSDSWWFFCTINTQNLPESPRIWKNFQGAKKHQSRFQK